MATSIEIIKQFTYDYMLEWRVNYYGGDIWRCITEETDDRYMIPHFIVCKYLQSEKEGINQLFLFIFWDVYENMKHGRDLSSEPCCLYKGYLDDTMELIKNTPETSKYYERANEILTWCINNIGVEECSQEFSDFLKKYDIDY